MLVVAASMMTGCYVQTSGPDISQRNRTPTMSGAEFSMEITEVSPGVTGLWAVKGTFKKDDEAVFVSLRNHSGVYVLGMPFAASRFAAIADKNSFHKGQWRSSNDVGVVVYEAPASAKGPGHFEFVPNPEYAQKANSLLRTPVSSEELFHCWLRDVSYAELDDYGHCSLPLNASELLQLKASAATPEYVVAIRKGGDFSARDIVQLRSHGVPEDYAVNLARAGLSFTAGEITHLRNYGVSAEEAAAWKKSGISLEANDMARLHNFGVPAAYGTAVHQLFDKAGVDDLIKLRNLGVPEPYLKEIKDVQGSFSIDDIARLRSYGVPVDYVKAWRNAGYQFDTAALIRLRNYGVPANFAAALKDMQLGVEDFVKLHNYGVTSDYVLAWNKAGYDFGVQDIVRLHAAGVPDNYAAALAVPGRAKLSADTILRLRLRGLSVEEIRALRE